MNTVRIVSNHPLSNKAKLMIGNQVIPFYEVDIHLAAGEFAILTASVPVNKIDLQAFEHNTHINVIHKHRQATAPAQPANWTDRARQWIQTIHDKFKRETK